MVALRYERPSKRATQPTRAGIGYPSTSLPPEGVTAMSEREHYDAIVIGSGQGGTPLATALARADRATALIEREHVGGTCVNVGCTPTKTMVASARVAYLARRGGDYGVRTGEITIDLARVRQRKQAIVEEFRSGGQRRLEQAENCELLIGETSF